MGCVIPVNVTQVFDIFCWNRSVGYIFRNITHYGATMLTFAKPV